MITDFLLDHKWLSPTVLGLIVVLSMVFGPALARRPRVAWLLGAVACIPIVLLTLVPVDRRLDARCVAQWSLPTPGRVELMANVVLFVAPTLLIALAMRRPWLVLAVAVAASVGIEALQAAAPAIGRSCDTNDLLSNTMGALIGSCLAWTILRLAAVSDNDDSPLSRGVSNGEPV